MNVIEAHARSEKKMWPLKVHYTLWFGSLSGILPYVSVFAQNHLQISATKVGVLFFVLPFLVSFVKPVACSVADHHGQHTFVLLIAQTLTLIGYGGLLFVPLSVDFISKTILWYLFCALALLANTAMGVGISLTDYLVINEVSEAKKRDPNSDVSYGQFRIWGTIGFGTFGILSGIINNNFEKIPYLLPGLVMFLVIETLDIFCIYQFYHRKSQSLAAQIAQPDSRKTRTEESSRISGHGSGSLIAIFNQVVQIYCHYPSLMQHTLVVFCFGILTSFHWSYFFWLIESIRGKDPLLMGLCIFVESFLGEIPFFLIAHRIIKFAGPVGSFCISLAAFAIRYLAYGYFLPNQPGRYWDILLVETLQGLTFGLFYTTMTHVAQHYAEKCDRRLSSPQTNYQTVQTTIIDGGQEFENDSGHNTVTIASKNKPSATMQGLMSAFYEGLGLGMGSLIAGSMIDQSGILSIWRFGAYLSITLIVLNLIIELIRFFRKKRISNTI